MEIKQMEFLRFNDEYQLLLLDEVEVDDSCKSEELTEEFWLRSRVLNTILNKWEMDSYFLEIVFSVECKDGFVYVSESDLGTQLDDITHDINDLKTLSVKLVRQDPFIKYLNRERAEVVCDEKWLNEDDENDVTYFNDCQKWMKYYDEMLDIIINHPEKIKLDPIFEKKIKKRRLKKIFEG